MWGLWQGARGRKKESKSFNLFYFCLLISSHSPIETGWSRISLCSWQGGELNLLQNVLKLPQNLGDLVRSKLLSVGAVQTECAQPHQLTAGWEMNFSSGPPLNFKHQGPESSPGSLGCKILQKICITLKQLIFYNFLTDSAQRQILGPQRQKMREKIWALGRFNSRFLPGVCWAETGNLKCLKCSFSHSSWPNK